MVLAVNVGNTHIIFGLCEGNDVVSSLMSIKTDRNQASFGYASEIMQVLSIAGYSTADIDGAIISSVVPGLTDIIKSAVNILCGKNALVVGAGIKSGIHIMTDDPGTVASDLVAMAVGAKENYPLPCVIVDMGTAVTFTVVDENARFIGGAFLPGINLSMNALSEEAALLPEIDIVPPKKAIASSTVECMRSGAVYGYAGAVEGIIDRFAIELGRQPESIITTGSLAEFICSNTKYKARNDSFLLLKGLCLMYNKNVKK